MSDILKTQRSFARKAITEPEHRFEDLYHLMTQPEWIATALESVLANQGAKTPGVDGVTQEHLQTVAQRADFITALRADLKAGTFKPTPVRRVWIPKPGKTEKRGLGVPTLADKVVQELLRMLMEPVWESDFLDCSHGFRPGHQTMDCIVGFWAHATRLQQYYWVIEGDIRKCFDRINHAILMKLVKRRIADTRVLTLIEGFLEAGMLDEGLFRETPEGTPQGGILSPLLANIYLNELDQWWWRKFGSRTHNEKRQNRRAGNGNAILTRYADDFCILWNGSHAGALALCAEVRQFLWDELHLELSEDKTYVTHLDDGIDFLGFHIQREIPSDNNRPWIRITPTTQNVQRFRAKIKALTRHNTTFMPVAEKFETLNRLIRGWGNYYRYVNFSHDAAELDWWINKRVLIWLTHKHKGLGVRAILDRYKMRQQLHQHNRWNFGTPSENGQMLYIAKLTDIRIQRYRHRKQANPYLDDKVEQPIPSVTVETPFAEAIANYTPEKTDWLETRLAVLERDGFRCVRCGNSSPPYYIHHILARKDGGGDALDNLETLCHKCHIQTESYGRNRTG